MQRPRTFSTEYLRVRDTLSRAEQVRLSVLEDEIAENPAHGRFERGEYRYATAADGLIIKYLVMAGGPVSFHELLDLRGPA